MCTYPDSEVPFPFYFNGEALPRWAPHWHICPIGDFLNHFVDDPENGWDEFVGFRHIWHLQCRLDHVGNIESEDPLIFHVCAQEVLKVMLFNQSRMIDSIRSHDTGEDTSENVFLQMIEGIGKMLELCIRDGCAFWTSGHENDRQHLIERMRRSRLPSEDPEYLQSPHQQKLLAEQILRARFQLTDLRNLAQSGILNKRLRQLVNQLPKLKDKLVAD